VENPLYETQKKPRVVENPLYETQKKPRVVENLAYEPVNFKPGAPPLVITEEKTGSIKNTRQVPPINHGPVVFVAKNNPNTPHNYDNAIKETNQNKQHVYDLAKPGTNSSIKYKNVSHGTEMSNKEIQTSLEEQIPKKKLVTDINVGTSNTSINSETSQRTYSSNHSSETDNNQVLQLQPNPINIVPDDNQEIKFIQGKVIQQPKVEKQETELEKRLRLQREKMKIDAVLDAFKTSDIENKYKKYANIWLEKIRNRKIKKEEIEKDKQALILELKKEIRKLKNEIILLELQKIRDKDKDKAKDKDEKIKALDKKITEKEKLLADLLKKNTQKGGSKKLKINKKRRKISRRTKKAQK
jgi:hypothetical protein